MPDLVLLVMKRRHVVTVVLRLGAVCAVLCGVTGLATVLARAAYWRAFRGLLDDPRVLNLTIWCLALMVLGISLGAMSSMLARWVVPLPQRQCPQCDYRLQKLAEPRCPECGLDLPRELISRKTSEANS